MFQNLNNQILIPQFAESLELFSYTQHGHAYPFYKESMKVTQSPIRTSRFCLLNKSVRSFKNNFTQGLKFQ